MARIIVGGKGYGSEEIRELLLENARALGCKDGIIELEHDLAALRAEKEQLTEALANLNDRYIHVSDLHIDKNARIAQLKAALRPFLKYGGHSLRQDTGDADYLVESFQLGTDEPKCELYMSDFRRAAAALKEEP